MAYATQGDLENALGGAQLLRQLADPNRTGSAQPAIIQDYLDDGAAQVRSAVEIKHDPEAIAQLDTPSLKRLIDANAALSARTAYEKGGQGMAMPEWVRERAERTDRFLDDLAKGFRRLGRVAGGVSAALGQPAQVVDPDPHGHHVSIHGFKRGFR